MGTVEILGFITGVLCVFLAIRENIWNWPIGIANNIFYLIVFWQAKLYADSGLQLFYMSIAIYGWWFWLRRGERRSGTSEIRTISPRMAWALSLVTIVSAVLLHLILSRYTDSTVPWGDGITTALSLTAQFMLGRKLLENWVVWMVADVIYIALYCYKHLYLTAVLYAIFFALCVSGYTRWRATLRAEALPV
ncbi:MAG: nicotinamide mononucleotide transporter [Acidobacteria bacterium]|nr:nicotinamide mononucleotide transporter [Acidobacteriota bacterium]MBW4044952.1 nicotinamide mononucleotide transporter [Acidobacteriota bacterium]